MTSQESCDDLGDLHLEVPQDIELGVRSCGVTRDREVRHCEDRCGRLPRIICIRH